MISMFTLGILFRTLVHKAVTSLQAQIRWILSGTPLQNTVNDLFSLFKFLHYQPWCFVLAYSLFHLQRHVWDSIINNGDNKKKETRGLKKHDSKDIHINLDIDTQTDLNRLRV